MIIKDEGGYMRRGTMLVGGTLCAVVILGTWMGVHAQRGSRSGQSLTVEDREEIRGLLHRYQFYLDFCPEDKNSRDFANLFTEDGRFMAAVSAGPILMVGDGRDGLTRMIRRADGTCNDASVRGPGNRINFGLNEIIEPSPEGARGTSYLLQVDGPGGQMYWNGWYEDIYVKTPAGWRFKQRIHIQDQRAGVPPAASQRRREIATASRAMPADPNVPVSRDPIKWVDGVDTRALQDTPAFAAAGRGR
jgi:hypothetical protein